MIRDPYLSLSKTEQTELIDTVAAKLNLAPAIIEKDYWGNLPRSKKS